MNYTYRVREIINSLLDSTIIDNNEDLSLLGLNSLKTINLVVLLEEHFGIIYLDEELLFDNFSNVYKIANKIEAKMQQRRNALTG